MEPIKGPAQRRQQLKSPFQSTSRSALFIILILQLQLIGLMSLADNDQASLSATSPKASVSSEQATTATTTKLESTQNEQPSAGGNPMGPRTDPGSEKSGTSPGVQAASSVPVPVTTTQDSLAGSMADADEGNVGAALAAASAKRTTVKKELAPTTEPTPSQADESSSSGDGSTRQPDTELQSQSQEQQPEQQSRQASPLASLLPSVNKQAGQLASMSPGLSGAISDIAEQLPSVYNRDGNYSTAGVNEDVAIQRLLPSNTNLFDKDAIDATQLGEMDCHLRNMDYCLAGLMGTAQKILPETNSELETRCDEMKATTSCLAVFNKRCSSFKILSVLAPYTQQSANLLAPSSTLLTDTQKEFVSSASSGLMSQPSVPLNGEPAVPSQMASLIPGAGRMVGSSASSSAPKASMSSLMEICEPHSKNTPENKELRKRLFQVAKCINARVPKLSPCLEDLKTAVQLFYEPRRVLPMRPTCCALARFRSCSMEAIDNVCGLSSFEQLMQSFSGQGSPVGMIKSIDRVCRQATDHRSAYCKEVLPPSGMKAPQRRGNKASKLAKALDLISFSPATQELG